MPGQVFASDAPASPQQARLAKIELEQRIDAEFAKGRLIGLLSILFPPFWVVNLAWGLAESMRPDLQDRARGRGRMKGATNSLFAALGLAVAIAVPSKAWSYMKERDARRVAEEEEQRKARDAEAKRRQESERLKAARQEEEKAKARALAQASWERAEEVRKLAEAERLKRAAELEQARRDQLALMGRVTEGMAEKGKDADLLAHLRSEKDRDARMESLVSGMQGQLDAMAKKAKDVQEEIDQTEDEINSYQKRMTVDRKDQEKAATERDGWTRSQYVVARDATDVNRHDGGSNPPTVVSQDNSQQIARAEMKRQAAEKSYERNRGLFGEVQRRSSNLKGRLAQLSRQIATCEANMKKVEGIQREMKALQDEGKACEARIAESEKTVRSTAVEAKAWAELERAYAGRNASTIARAEAGVWRELERELRRLYPPTKQNRERLALASQQNKEASQALDSTKKTLSKTDARLTYLSGEMQSLYKAFLKLGESLAKMGIESREEEPRKVASPKNASEEGSTRIPVAVYSLVDGRKIDAYAVMVSGNEVLLRDKNGAIVTVKKDEILEIVKTKSKSGN